MAALAALLSWAMPALDRRLGQNWLDAEEWLYGNEPEAAQLLLSILAGSMLGVAGVIFSVTIAAVGYASSQFGPRIVTNFMRDRINQVTLGTFVATFVYCLLVLREVDPGGDSVPHLSMLVALIFAIASIGVLIEFIHHISDSINATSAMAAIGRELRLAVDEAYPERLAGDGAAAAAEAQPAILPPEAPHDAVPVPASATGYVQAISHDALIEAAVEHDLTIRVVRPPGDFVAEGRAVAYAWPAERVKPEVVDGLRHCFAYGRRRTPHQDLRLPLDQLVEMAGRALSPAVNDPMTAIGCLNWLAAALSQLARRPIRSGVWADERAVPRLVIVPLQYDDLAEAVFGRLRPYFAADRNARFAMMRIIGDVLVDTIRYDDRVVLLTHARRLAEDAGSRATIADDRAALDAMLRDLAQLARLEPGPLPMPETPEWMEGEA